MQKSENKDKKVRIKGVMYPYVLDAQSTIKFSVVTNDMKKAQRVIDYVNGNITKKPFEKAERRMSHIYVDDAPMFCIVTNDEEFIRYFESKIM